MYDSILYVSIEKLLQQNKINGVVGWEQILQEGLKHLHPKNYHKIDEKTSVLLIFDQFDHNFDGDSMGSKTNHTSKFS